MSTNIQTVLDGIDAVIATKRAELAELLRARDIVVAAMSPANPLRRTRKGVGATPGSLDDRIISAALSPTTLKAIVEASNAREPDVAAAVRRLVKDGQLVKDGKSRGTTYRRA